MNVSVRKGLLAGSDPRRFVRTREERISDPTKKEGPDHACDRRGQVVEWVYYKNTRIDELS